MAKIFLIIFILCLMLTSYAWWAEKIDVWVIDAKGRGIPNANVTIVYQSSACDKHASITQQTNSTGMAHFEFMNTVEETAVTKQCVEKSYVINTNYASVSNSTTAIVGERKQYVIVLPVVKYTLKVFGFNNITLPGVYGRFSGYEFRDSLNSILNFYVPIGKSIDVEVIYGNISKTMRVNVNEDTISSIELPVYNLRVKLFNEMGERISGSIKVDNVIKYAAETEETVFERFPYSSAKFEITLKNTTRVVEVGINSELVNIYVDFSPPSITDVSLVENEKKNVKISATVVDLGQYSSGIYSNPFVKYKFTDETNKTTEGWIEQKMYPLKFQVFETTIPAGGKDFMFEIHAIDKQQNENIYTGNYSFKKTTGGGGIKIEVGEISISHIIGIIIFVFIIFLIYKKIRAEI